jgi:hypothetical protein
MVLPPPQAALLSECNDVAMEEESAILSAKGRGFCRPHKPHCYQNVLMLQWKKNPLYYQQKGEGYSFSFFGLVLREIMTNHSLYRSRFMSVEIN